MDRPWIHFRKELQGERSTAGEKLVSRSDPKIARAIYTRVLTDEIDSGDITLRNCLCLRLFKSVIPLLAALPVFRNPVLVDELPQKCLDLEWCLFQDKQLGQRS